MYGMRVLSGEKSIIGLIYWLFLLFFTNIASFLHASAQDLLNPSEIVLKIGMEDQTPRSSEGSFITLKDGSILFAYSHFQEASGDHAGAFIAGRYSQDGGRTWSEKDSVIVANEGGMNVMSASLLRLENGSIALFYIRKNSLDDCIPFMRKSFDETLTWTDPVRIIQDKEGYFVLNNDRVIQLKSGRLVAPVSLHKTKGSDFDMVGKIYCYTSDDRGETWQSSKMVPNSEGTVLQEPGVIELQDGRIMMWLRTDKGLQYITYSRDQAYSWQNVAPSNIASPRAPASIKRIPHSGNLLLIWNNNDGSIKETASHRTPMDLAISKDEGKTWENIKTIEDDPNGFFCYTAIEFLEAHVLLGYMAAERKKLGEKIPSVVRRIDINEITGN